MAAFASLNVLLPLGVIARNRYRRRKVGHVNRRWLGPVVSVVVTVLSVATMSSLGVGVLVGLVGGDTALPCDRLPGTAQPFEGDRHIAYEGAPHEPYRTVPPTSGPHSPRVVVPGIYRDAVPEELQVHALEHGHVLVQYAPDVPPGDVEKLERLGRPPSP